MDGRGRFMDNIFIERLWRSLKYEAVYLHEIADGLTARRVTGESIDFYNIERPTWRGVAGPRSKSTGTRPCGYDGQAARRLAPHPYTRSTSNRKIDPRGYW